MLKLFQIPRRKKLAAISLGLASIIAQQPGWAGEFTNFLGMKFVSIPEGKFKMGVATKTDDAKLDELPQHEVTVGEFQIMPTEVTLAQYKRYVIESTKLDVLGDEFMSANRFDENAPVVYISWNDIRFFLHWLNINKPQNDTGEYTLPTEAQWEYACRAGVDTLYCGSNTAGEVAWNASNKLNHVQPVAQKKANAFGLYDMSGNAREWVTDCYHASYVSAPSDAAVSWDKRCDDNSAYVARGGSWEDQVDATRSTSRMVVKFNKQDLNTGFRLVRRAPASESQ